MFLEHPPTSDSVDVLFANDLQSEARQHPWWPAVWTASTSAPVP